MNRKEPQEDDFETPRKFMGREKTPRKLLSIPPSPFLEKLGYGTGVNVWKLTHTPKINSTRSPWAIKNVRKNLNEPLSNKYQSLLQKEAVILKSLQHENIVGFRGYLQSEDGRNCLAMEVGGDSLGNLIEERVENDLGPYPPKTILKVALHLAKALKYLHEDKRILHGDIKPQNVVIKGDFQEIKLCDFGVSLDLNDSQIAQKYVGTPVYSAPECLKGPGEKITEKADMFSFGLVLFEMMSLFPPHCEDLANMDDTSLSESQLEESSLSVNTSNINIHDGGGDVGDGGDDGDDDDDDDDDNDFHYGEENYGTRPPLPSEAIGEEYKQVIEIFYACTEQDPEKRPSASMLMDYLETIL